MVFEIKQSPHFNSALHFLQVPSPPKQLPSIPQTSLSSPAISQSVNKKDEILQQIKVLVEFTRIRLNSHDFTSETQPHSTVW
ncbi:hypothetical protein U1Q18_024862 [Sarracenia purpurea var. burkii]